MTTMLCATIATPLGPLAVLGDGEVVVAAGFASPQEMAARLAPSASVRPSRALEEVAAAVTAYFDGELTALDRVPVRQPGGPFQQAAWAAMRAVPPGETVTYAELAARAGSPLAVRAAGSACARNLIAPIVPCHRIVRTGGGRGGYYYGLSRKEWLLAHERGEAPSAAELSASA